MPKILRIKNLGDVWPERPIVLIVARPKLRALIKKATAHSRKENDKAVSKARKQFKKRRIHEALDLLTDTSLGLLQTNNGRQIIKKILRENQRSPIREERELVEKKVAAAAQNTLLSAKIVTVEEISGLSELFLLAAPWQQAFCIFDALSENNLLAGIPVKMLQKHFPRLIRKANSETELNRMVEVARSVDLLDDKEISAEIDRRSIALVQRMGIETNEASPLLNPEVFAQFVKEKDTPNGSLFDRLPSLTQKNILEGQYARPIRSERRHADRLRVLYVSDNWNFSEVPVRELENNNFDVRLLHFSDVIYAIDKSQNSKGLGVEQTVTRQLQSLAPNLMSYDEMHSALEEAFPIASRLIEWCDIVVCEWWTSQAKWFSRYLDGAKTLIVRCHSFEAFGLESFRSNIQGVDGTIFIADHIRKVFLDVTTGVAPIRMNTTVVENLRDLPLLTFRERNEQERFTLGLTQYASANKDPIFAIKILEHLRAQDTRWRLKFVGNPWPENANERETEYAKEFAHRIQALGNEVAVEPRTNEINSWLHGIGFILSTSYREGSHESLVEGALTGAIPVLRKWPMVASYGAPAGVFPQFPSFETPKEAADHILELQKHFDENSTRTAKTMLKRVESSKADKEFCAFIEQCYVRRRLQ